LVAQAINEPRHWDEIDRGSNGHRQQPGGCHLPPGIPSTHHYPLIGRAGQRACCALGWPETGRSPRDADYGTSRFARNRKLIAARSRPGNRMVADRPGHPAATRSDAFPEAHRKCAGPGVSGWVDAEARWQSDVWDRTLPANRVGASGGPGRDFGHAATALLIALTGLLDRLAGWPASEHDNPGGRHCQRAAARRSP